MNRKIICIVIVSMFLLTTSAFASSLKVDADNELKNIVLNNTNDDWYITLEINFLHMEDVIDPEDQRTENTTYFADWLIKVWVTDGVDDDGDDYWEYIFPPDNAFFIYPDIHHSWKINSIDEVCIKIELWDIDDGGELEQCDINGYSQDEYSVEFKYYPFDNSFDYSGSGGSTIGGYISGSRFYGGSDGTEGNESDDNDVTLIIGVTDNYNPAELKFFLRQDCNGVSFGELKVGVPTNMTFILKNIGDFTAEGRIYIDDEIVLDDNPERNSFENFVIIQGAGEFTLEPGEEMEIVVSFNPDKAYFILPPPLPPLPPTILEAFYKVILIADGNDPCIDNYLYLKGCGMENPNGEPPAKPSTPQGSNSGSITQEYEYTTSTTDPDGNKISYGWDWDGDYNVDEWTDYYESGSIVSVSNFWDEDNSYTIRVIAKDENGQYSKWSDPLSVSMPKSRTFNPLLDNILARLLDNHPIIRTLFKLKLSFGL